MGKLRKNLVKINTPITIIANESSNKGNNAKIW